MFYCRLQGQASWLLESGWGLIPRLKACLKEIIHLTSSTQVSMVFFLCVAACDDQPVKVKRVCCRCVHPHCGRRADDGCWFFWMLWCHPGVPLHAGIGNPPHYILKYHYFVVLWCYQPWCLTVVVFSPQFFFFLLVIFAVEVAAGIWGFSNQTKVGVSNAQCTCKHTDGAPNSSYYDCVHRLLTI